MAVMETADTIRDRLRWDTPLLAENFLGIVPKGGGGLVPLIPKPEQLRFDAALEAQRAQGQPMRAVILKARQIGFSTWTQAKLIQRATQTSYHRALVLAQNNDTAGELFNMGYRMWDNLIEELRPVKVGGRKARLLELDNHSWYRADNAREFEAGRGLTLHSVHGSEVASFPDAERKLMGVLEAVPDEPDTLVVLESTAKGQNYFKDLWDQAETGESGYLPFFSPWFEERGYRQAFANDRDRDDFLAVFGEGTEGEDEPELLDLMRSRGFENDDIYEALNWRRHKLRRPPLNGDIDKFHQEYPSTPEEAFLTTGRHVFDIGQVRRMQTRVRQEPPPVTGTLEVVGPMVQRESRGMVVRVPKAVEFVEGPINDDRRPGWRVWELPVAKTDETPAGQYVIGVDASGGDEVEGGSDQAYHAMEVIDHRTRVQVAEYRSRIDADLLALEAFKAALFFNMPWVAIEVTGSWGLPAAKRLKWDYRYPFVYQRPKVRSASSPMKTEDVLGWHTGFETKQLLIAELREALREGEDGIRSRGLAEEYGTYVRDDRNRAKPEWGKTADRLMAHGIAFCVAKEKPLMPDRPRGGVSTTRDHLVLSSRTGYRR